MVTARVDNTAYTHFCYVHAHICVRFSCYTIDSNVTHCSYVCTYEIHVCTFTQRHLCLVCTHVCFAMYTQQYLLLMTCVWLNLSHKQTTFSAAERWYVWNACTNNKSLHYKSLIMRANYLNSVVAPYILIFTKSRETVVDTGSYKMCMEILKKRDCFAPAWLEAEVFHVFWYFQWAIQSRFVSKM